jgi:hypothetical protein
MSDSAIEVANKVVNAAAEACAVVGSLSMSVDYHIFHPLCKRFGMIAHTTKEIDGLSRRLSSHTQFVASLDWDSVSQSQADDLAAGFDEFTKQ